MTSAKKNINVFLCVFLLINIHCGKTFLENPSTQEIYRQKYITDIDGCQQYLNGAYIQLCQVYSGLQNAYPELVADNIKPAPGKSVLLSFYHWSQQPSQEKRDALRAKSVNANGIAVSNYYLITMCNYLLNNIDKYRQENPEQADNIKGQAYLIRSLTYFQLVNIFAQSYNFTGDGSHQGIAYIKTDDWTDGVKQRASVSEVYNEMINDVEESYKLLPTQQGSSLQPSKSTATAILSRLHLFKGNYLESKNYALLTIKNKPLLSTENGYPDKIFKQVSPEQTETLFQLVPAALIYSDLYSLAGNYLGMSFRNKEFVATKDIADIIQENNTDIRSKWIDTTSGSKMVTKFPTGVVGSGGNSTQYYHCVIRSSELYLNIAESYVKLNMEDSARYYLNLVRKRSDPTIDEVTATGTTLWSLIKRERRKELAFEGIRLFDIQRWKDDIDRSDPLTPNSKSLPYPSNKSVSPIPQMDVTVYGLSQNPGY